MTPAPPPPPVTPPTPRLRLELLGPFGAAVDGSPIPPRAWRLRKAQSIVKLLALAPERTLPRERVVDALWPDFSPEDAANNLRRTLHAARQALGAGNALAGSRGGLLRLDPTGGVAVDVDEFRAALAAARASADPAAYDAALALYRGDLLPEDAAEPWAEAPRVLLRGEYLAALAERARGAQTPRHNLPSPHTTFIGRDRELALLERQLTSSPATRLLTLAGPGGAGKTRLALELGRRLLARYPDGVWLADLAPLADAALVTQTAAAALGVRERGAEPLDAVLDACRPRALLVILDNCEHVLDEAAALADALVSHCPCVTVLATSRERLGLPGELVWPVPPLTLPDASSLLSDPGEAVALYVDRAARANPGFALTPETAPRVAEVCRALDGLPLAIELAAAHGLSVAALPARQRSLDAAIDWSYALLEPPEQRLFAELAVFSGGFTLDAAAAVSGDPAVAGPLAALVAKSLLTFQPLEARYRLLTVLQQYAHRRLERSGRLAALRACHASFYMALAETAAPLLRGPDQAAWLDRLEREHDNLRAALDHLAARGEVDEALRLAVALTRFWEIRSHRREGRARLERLLALPAAHAPTHLRAAALSGAHVLAHQLGDFRAAVALAEESLAISRALGDTAGIGRSLYHLGVTACLRGEMAVARDHLQESVPLLRAAGDSHLLGWALQFLGVVRYSQGALPAARSLLEESLALRRAADDRRGAGITLCALSLVATAEEQLAESQTLVDEGSRLLSALDDRWFLAMALVARAVLAAALGQREAARSYSAEATTLAAQIREPLPPFIVALQQRVNGT